MPYYYITETNFDPSVVTKYEELLKWFEQSLNEEYHIFIEFKVPAGREIDFLILARDGIWLIEHKQHDFIEILNEGNWKYKDHRGQERTLIKKVKTGYENPYRQATNTGNNFASWLRRNNHLGNNLRKRKKIYPCVTFPDYPTEIAKQETDLWCYISKGVEGIQKNMENRRWEEGDWITEEAIENIATALNLERISYTDLIQHKANLEKIFMETSKAQVQEVKKIFAETNQVFSNNDWIFCANLKEEKSSPRFKEVPLTDFNKESLPFILTGDFGSGKTVVCYQIMEYLLKKHLGFYFPVREIIVTKENESHQKILFKGKDYTYPINVNQDIFENVENEVNEIIVFLIKTLIATYNEKGLIDQITNGIKNYLNDQRFFIILDGWDEISSHSRSLLKKILDYLLIKDVAVIVSCRTPLDVHLPRTKVDSKKIPIYNPIPLPEQQMIQYISERIKNWLIDISAPQILSLLKKTYDNNITPFHLYAMTIVPITEPPKNTAQLLRWMIIAQVGWELLKERKDEFKDIKTIQDLINLLKKEMIIIGTKEISLYNAIFDYQEIDNDKFPNGSIVGLLNVVTRAEYEGTNIELSFDSIIEINSLVKPFVEHNYHPEGLYTYPRVKTKLLQDYFLAESAYNELIRNNKKEPLITLDVFLIFDQLLNIDNRWKKVQGKALTRNELLVDYLTKSPVELRPTVQEPSYQMIGGGMRAVESRIRLGVPDWFKRLFSACISKIKVVLVLQDNLMVREEALEAFLKLQRTVPEITSDTIYDQFVKDREFGGISQSKEPSDYTQLIIKIFPEYLEKRATVMDKIDEYCQRMEQEKHHDEDDYYSLDDYICQEKEYRELSFLLSIQEFSGSSGLKYWSLLVIRNSGMQGQLVSYLLQEELPSSVLDVLLVRYQKLISSWVDQELGVTMPGEWDFEEEVIFKSFIMNARRGVSKETLGLFWKLLIDYSNDLNLIEFLMEFSSKLDLETVQLLYRITLLYGFHNKHNENRNSGLLIQYSENFKPISMILNYEEAQSLLLTGYPLTNDEIQWFLNNNMDEIIEESLDRKTRKESSDQKEIAKNQESDTQNQLKRLGKILTNRKQINWKLRDRFKIYQTALVQGVSIDIVDFSKTINEFGQIDWVLKALNLDYISVEPDFPRNLFAALSSKIKAIKAIIEGQRIDVFKIIFYRLITYETCDKKIVNKSLLDSETEEWLRNSTLSDESMLDDDWREIERLVRKRLPDYFREVEFCEFVSDQLKSDNENKIKPKYLAELMFSSYPDRDKENSYNWEKIVPLFTEQFLNQLLEEVRTVSLYDSPVFSLLLKTIPFHEKKVSEFILGIFEEETEDSRLNVYHSCLTRITERLLKTRNYTMLLYLIQHVSIRSFIFIVYAIRKITFPEQNDLIRIIPVLTKHAQENLNDLTSAIQTIISRLYNERENIEDQDEIDSMIDYLFDIIVGLQPNNKEELLELLFFFPIIPYDFEIWVSREKNVILSNKDRYYSLIVHKKQWLMRQEESTNKFKYDEINSMIKVVDILLNAFDNKLKPENLDLKEILYPQVRIYEPINLETYIPSTTTEEGEDFHESINILTFNEQILLLIRLLFGREVVLVNEEVIIKDIDDTEGRFQRLFPYNKRNGIEILLKTLDPVKLVLRGKKLLSSNKKQQFAFLNYIVNRLNKEDQGALLKHLNEEEYEAIRLTLILSILENHEKSNQFF